MFICLSTFANILLLLFFLLLLDGENPLSGRPLKEEASIGEFDKIPLKITLLLPSDVLTIKLSSGINRLILWGGKV